MITEVCSKCGAETSYGGDLHCRKIFIDEMSELLSAQDLDKARSLYFSVSFDGAWMEHFLYSKGGELGKLILDDIQRVKAEQHHREFLNSLGIRYNGVTSISATRKHRITNCYSCKKSLDNSVDIECNICRWIICRCGACGCGYNGESRTA